MSLSYVDFIAPNVEVCVKYFVDKEPRWFTGKVVRILDRYIDDNIDECVKCVVKYDKKKYTEVFSERDYDTDEENAWCFGERFVALVENVKSIVDDYDITESEGSEDEVDTNDESKTDTCSEDEHTEAQDTHSEGETNSTENGNILGTSTKRSVWNSVGATIFMMAPWIATGIAIFNARNELLEAFKQ